MRAAREASSAMIFSPIPHVRASRREWSSSRCAWPRIVVSGLLISWATPEASSPTAISFSAWTSWAVRALELLELAQRLGVKPRVVERDADLVGRGLDQRHLALVEGVAVWRPERQRAQDPAATVDRHAQEAADLVLLDGRLGGRQQVRGLVVAFVSERSYRWSATRPMSPAPIGEARLISRSRADMPRSPRSSSVRPSSVERCRLEISWPVTCVSASTAVRRTSSTSSERLTASATVCRISRCARRRGGDDAPGDAGQPARGSDRRAASSADSTSARSRTGRSPQLGGDVRSSGDLVEVLSGVFGHRLGGQRGVPRPARPLRGARRSRSARAAACRARR